MRKRPTAASLRAGQTLYVIHPGAGMVAGVVNGSILPLDNAFVTDLRNDPAFPWKWAFYSRRQAHSAASRECNRRRAAWRDAFTAYLAERVALGEKLSRLSLAQAEQVPGL